MPGGPHHARSRSGSTQASKTSARGAWNVRTTRRPPGSAANIAAHVPRGPAEVRGERVELPLPEAPVLAEPAVRGAQRLRSEPAPAHAALLALLDKAGAREHAEMLRHRGEGHVERLGELADGRVAAASRRTIARRVGSASAANTASSSAGSW